MYRAYMGNLDSGVSEETLDGLLRERGLSPDNILIKRGYAFVDLPDQNSLDKAIDSLHGHNLMGSVMQVEPSLSKRRRSNRIQIRNVPAHVPKEELDRLVTTFGNPEKCDIVTSNMETTVNVMYETPDQAQQAMDQLNNYDYQGSVLKVDYMPNGTRGPRGDGRPRAAPRNSGNTQNRGSGYPLRILVPSEFVGAIIGRKGQTIRNITTQSRARVDVHRDDNAGMLEKVISIYGQPENCTNACKEILKVMQQEATSTNRAPGYNSQDPYPPNEGPPRAGGPDMMQHKDITLKMLADDRYCGRIIGKEGKVIKKIREDTDTRITVSKNYSYAYHSVQEMPAMYPDRVITIKGTIDNMSAAEASISQKLRECIEKEMQAPNIMMQGGMSGMPMMGGGMGGGMGGAGMYGMMPYGMGRQGGYQASAYGGGGGLGGGGQGMYPGAPQPQAQAQSPAHQGTFEQIQICVPNSSVGAIIGSGGSNIKQIIRDSNAFVTIEPKRDEDPNPAAERTVTIKGMMDAQWRASFYIFEKLRQEGFAGQEDVRLRTIIKIPKQLVGRVIGKSGKNVRDVQRMTGALVKLPEDKATQGDETFVEIFATFMAAMSAISRIRALINQTQQPPAGGPPMGGGGPPPAGVRGPRGGPPPNRGGPPQNNYPQN